MIELETLGPWGRSVGAVPNWRSRDGTWGNNVVMAPRATLVWLDWVLNDVGAVFTDFRCSFMSPQREGLFRVPCFKASSPGLCMLSRQWYGLRGLVFRVSCLGFKQTPLTRNELSQEWSQACVGLFVPDELESPWQIDLWHSTQTVARVLDNTRSESSPYHITFASFHLLRARSFNLVSGKAQALLDCLGKEFADPTQTDVGMCFVNEASCLQVCATYLPGFHVVLARHWHMPIPHHV